MVKIKEGYVMTASEKAEFDRVNALPRRQEGRIITISRKRKYPPRIYVFMHAELWRDRNRRPMVLFYAYPFLSRAFVTTSMKIGINCSTPRNWKRMN